MLPVNKTDVALALLDRGRGPRDVNLLGAGLQFQSLLSRSHTKPVFMADAESGCSVLMGWI